MKYTLVSLASVLAAVWSAACGPKVHDVALPDIAASDDAELVARGEYLFHGPAHCTGCHVPNQQTASMRGGERPAPVGGHVWKMGPMGTIRSANLTSDEETGVGAHSDAELARAIRHGVLKDGTLSFFMALAVGKLADDDVAALVSYMRTIPPQKNAVGKSELSPLGALAFGGFSPKEAGPQKAPPLQPTVERGKYVAETLGMCIGCHSGMDRATAKIKPGMEYAGALAPGPGLLDDDPNLYMPPNLTPDEETGIAGTWTEEQFVARMKAGRFHLGSPMPWANYQNMHDDDLKALWLYLQTVPPVKRDTGSGVRPKK